MARFSRYLEHKLDQVFEGAIDTGTMPPMVVAVTNEEHTVYQKGFGLDTNTAFWIASMTKPITSVSILQLADQGRLGLRDPLSKYLPQYMNRPVIEDFDYSTGQFHTRPAKTEITIQHLLTHTAGFGYAFCNPIVNQLTKHGEHAEDLPLLHDPGDRWTYGGSTKILGDVISQITGRKFYEYQKTDTLALLGMARTDYFLSESDIRRRPRFHYRVDDKLTVLPEGPFEPGLYADGGLWGTAEDYLTFLRMLLNRGVTARGHKMLSDSSIDALLTNQIGDLTVQRQPGVKLDWSCDFPLGVGIDKFSAGFQLQVVHEKHMRAPGSISWGGLFNTHFWADPANGLAAVFLTHLLPFYDHTCMEILQQFERRLYEQLM